MKGIQLGIYLVAIFQLLSTIVVSMGASSNLVGGLEHFLSSHIVGIVTPIDFHIFQRQWNHQPVIVEDFLGSHVWLPEGTLYLDSCGLCRLVLRHSTNELKYGAFRFCSLLVRLQSWQLIGSCWNDYVVDFLGTMMVYKCSSQHFSMVLPHINGAWYTVWHGLWQYHKYSVWRSVGVCCWRISR